MRSKLVFKRFSVESLLSFSGIHGLLEHLRLSEKAFILMYHRVLPATGQLPEYVQPGMFVTTATFEKQISYLRDSFEILFLDEMAAKVKKGEPLGGQCVLTFDDGWLDNYSEAFPAEKVRGSGNNLSGYRICGNEQNFLAGRNHLLSCRCRCRKPWRR